MVDTLHETVIGGKGIGAPAARLGSLLPNNCNREQDKGLRVVGMTAAFREHRARALESRPGAGRWHVARASGLRRRVERIERCGVDLAAVGACACGGIRLVARTCGDRFGCEACRAKVGRRALARTVRAVPELLRAARLEWSGRGALEAHRPGLRLLTLTTRHTGDVSADRATIQAAWSRHRAWLDRQWNTRAARRAGLPRVRLRYVAAWELTPGRDGLGHAHLHVALICPRYDYGRAREAWSRHTDGAAETYSVVGSKGREREQGTAAARYVAKYLTKGLDALPDPLAAAWWCASYAKRNLAASRGAWLPRDPCSCSACGTVGEIEWSAGRGTMANAVEGLASIDPATGPPTAPVEGLATWAVLC